MGKVQDPRLLHQLSELGHKDIKNRHIQSALDISLLRTYYALKSRNAEEPTHSRATDGMTLPATENVIHCCHGWLCGLLYVIFCVCACLTVGPHGDEDKPANLGSDPAASQVPDMLTEKNEMIRSQGP